MHAFRGSWKVEHASNKLKKASRHCTDLQSGFLICSSSAHVLEGAAKVFDGKPESCWRISTEQKDSLDGFHLHRKEGNIVISSYSLSMKVNRSSRSGNGSWCVYLLLLSS
eukprot:m.40877 g.40877  ORF g.40877 m.40877 type:complete len:110 (+) comp10386_c0_seq1:511-840(+)